MRSVYTMRFRCYCFKAGVNLNSVKEIRSSVFTPIWILTYWRYFLIISVNVIWKLGLSKPVIFGLEKTYFERNLSNWAEVFRICCYEQCCVSNIELIDPVNFVEVWHWKTLKRMLDFLYQIWLITISCVFNFSKIPMLKKVSYLSSF